VLGVIVFGNKHRKTHLQCYNIITCNHRLQTIKYANNVHTSYRLDKHSTS